MALFMVGDEEAKAIEVLRREARKFLESATLYDLNTMRSSIAASALLP